MNVLDLKDRIKRAKGPTPEQRTQAALILLASSQEDLAMLDHPGGLGMPPFAIIVARGKQASDDARAWWHQAKGGGA